MPTVRFFARCFHYGGASGAMVSSFVGLIGIIAAISGTPGFCPKSLSPARCSATAHNGANLAAYSLVATAAFGVLSLGGYLAEDSIPEA